MPQIRTRGGPPMDKKKARPPRSSYWRAAMSGEDHRAAPPRGRLADRKLPTVDLAATAANSYPPESVWHDQPTAHSA